MFPRMKRFTVTGIFHVGAGEIDGYVALANIADMARLQRWQPDQVQGLRLRFADLFQAPRIAWELAGQLGDDLFPRLDPHPRQPLPGDPHGEGHDRAAAC